jgi:hypothetical protein
VFSGRPSVDRPDVVHHDATVADDDQHQGIAAPVPGTEHLSIVDSEADGYDRESADDETWQALEKLVIDMRKRAARRNGPLQAALSASLDDLAVDAAALAADGGLGELPWEEKGAVAGNGRVLEAPAPPAPARPAETAASAVDLAWRLPPSHRPADSEPAEETVAEMLPVSTPEDTAEPAVTEAVEAWEPAAESPTVNEDVSEPGPVADAPPPLITVTEPLPTPEPDEAPAAPLQWRVGASRTNPVPPATTDTKPPWAPAVAAAVAAPVMPPPPPAPAPDAPAGTAETHELDPADQVAKILAGLRGQSDGKSRGKSGSAAAAMAVDPVWFPEEGDDTRHRGAHSAPNWLLGGAAAVVILISAIVTYLLLHG